MKNNKLWKIILPVVLLLQVVAQVLTAVAVMRLNMLPDKYLIVLLAGMVLLTAITASLMFLAKKRVLACILALLIVLGCGFVARLVTDAYRTVSTVTDRVTTTTRNVYVFVLSEDPAQKLQDAADYSFGFVENYDVKHTDRAIERIGEVVGKDITLAPYTRASEMATALYGKQVGALIMNGASVALLLEEEGFEDFTEKVRILDTMSYTLLEEQEETEPPQTTEPTVPGDVTNTPFVIYISGSDTRSSMLTVSRSDVNILAVVNPVTKQVLLINTPRDYFVPNPEGDGAMDKLTHLGLYGPECSMQTLGELYDLSIDYYGQINFTGFEKLVDAVGGVTVYSDQAFRARNTYISVGENNLNGSQALDFSRERYNVSGGDNGRGKNQMKIVKAVIEKLTNGTTIISRYSAILQSLEGMFSTSMGMSDISMLVKMQLGDMASWNIQSFAVTGVGGSERTYSIPGDYAYVMHEDEASTAYAAELAARVIAGETLTDEDMKLPKK